MSAVIVALLAASGTLATAVCGYLIARAQARSATETATESTGATMVVEAVKAWQAVATDAQQKAAHAESTAQAAQASADKALAELGVERAHSRAQDRQIHVLRELLHGWARFGQQLHDRWDLLRQSETPPDLPDSADSDNT